MCDKNPPNAPSFIEIIYRNIKLIISLYQSVSLYFYHILENFIRLFLSLLMVVLFANNQCIFSLINLSVSQTQGQDIVVGLVDRR